MSIHTNHAIAGIVLKIDSRSQIEASYNPHAGLSALGGSLPRRKANALDDVAAQYPEIEVEFVRLVKRCKRSGEDVDKIRNRLANLSPDAPIATARKRIRHEGEAVRLRKRFLKRARLWPVTVAAHSGSQYSFTFSPMLFAVAQPALTAAEDIDVSMSTSSDDLFHQDVNIDQQQALAQELFSVHQVVDPAGVRGASEPVSTDNMEIEDKPRTDLALDSAASIPQGVVDQVMIPVDMNTSVPRSFGRFAVEPDPPNLSFSSAIHDAGKTFHCAATPIGTPCFNPYTLTQQAPAPLENHPGRPASPMSDGIATVTELSEENIAETDEEESLFTPKTSAANSPCLDFLEEGDVSPAIECVALDSSVDTRELSTSLEDEDLYSGCFAEGDGGCPSQAILPRASSLLVLPETGESWVEVDSPDLSPAEVQWLVPTQYECNGPYSPVRGPVQLEEDVFGPVLLLNLRRREYAARQIVGVEMSYPVDANWSEPQSHALIAEDIPDETMHEDHEEFCSLPPSPSPSSPSLSSTERDHSDSHRFAYRFVDAPETEARLADSLPSLCSMDSANSSSDGLLAYEFPYSGMVSSKTVVNPRMWHYRESRILQDTEEDDEAVVVKVDEALEWAIVPGATDSCLEPLVSLLDKWTCEDACDSSVSSHADSLFSSDTEIWYDALDDDASISPVSLGDLDQMVCDPPTDDTSASNDTSSGYACSSVSPSSARIPVRFFRDRDFAYASPPQAVAGDYDAPSVIHSSPRLHLGERSSFVTNSPLALAATSLAGGADAFWGSPSLFDLDSEARPTSPSCVLGPPDALEALRRDVLITCTASPAPPSLSGFNAPQDDLELSELQDARSVYFDFDESAALVSPAPSSISSPVYILPGAWQDNLDSMDDIHI
ncbi:hypothetical protein C8Q73DRAFT_147405 [Cubamyces lactineus]|nr:hypothetical protein C8Q73DRAFT_147405 [Cubamyces lactineus]